MVARLHADDFLLYSDVVRLESFTAAAKANNLTPAAVSKRISQLEEHLGVTLLHRTTRSLSTTEEGRLLYDYAQQLRFEVAQAKEVVLNNHQEMQGKISLSGTPMFMRHVICPLIANFVNEHPKVTFDLSVTKPGNAFFGEFDVVFGALPTENMVHSLGQPRKHVLAASPTYLEAMGKPKTLDGLKKHRCILFPYIFLKGLGCWSFIHKGRQKEVLLPGHINTKSADVLMGMALSGAGVALLPLGAIEGMFASEELVQILPEYVIESAPVHYKHPYEGAFMPKRLRVFLDMLHEALD